MSDRVRWTVVPLLLLAFALAPAAARAESIWANRKADAAFLYSDNLANDVGDCLTVLIADQSSFKLEGEREMEKTTGHSASINVETSPLDISLPVGAMEHTSSRTMEGSDEYTGSRQFTDSIAVTVKDRLPNGNIVIAGRKERVIAGERAVTVLTGIARPEDVGAGNTISSGLVAHLNIQYETAGSSNAYVKEGFVNRALSYVWPF